MNVSIVVALIAGFTGSGVSSIILYILQRIDKKKEAKKQGDSLEAQMMKALGHDRIISLAHHYIRREAITMKERSNIECLYLPYKALGGNGDGKVAYEACAKLPVVSDERAEEMDREIGRSCYC